MVEEIVALIADLVERGHAYAVEGDVYFRVRSLPEYGALSHRDVDQMDQGEGVEGAALQGGPARLRALEGAEADGGHRLGLALGPRPAGLAHRVLGDGRGDARRAARDPRRRQRPDLPAPRERGGADARRARPRRSPQIWMHNGMLQMGDEKMAKSVGNIRGLAEVLDEAGRDALVWFFCEGHYRQPLAFTRERLDDAARRVERIRDAGRRLAAGASRRRSWRATATRSSTRWPTTSTRRARWRRWRTGSARPTAPTAPVGDSHLREMLGVLGLENLLDAGEGAPPEVVELAERRAAARAEPRLRRGRPAARRAARARLGGPRRRRGPELVPIGP